MDEHQVVWNEKVAEKIIKNLKKRRMAGSYCASAENAKIEIDFFFKPEEIVG